MNKKFNTWVFALMALALIVLLFGAIGSSITGNGIFSFLKTNDPVQGDEDYNGLLANSYLEEGKSIDDLKGYQITYNDEGEIILEVIDGKAYFGPGFVAASGGANIEQEPLTDINCGPRCPIGVPPAGDCGYDGEACDDSMCECYEPISGYLLGPCECVKVGKNWYGQYVVVE